MAAANCVAGACGGTRRTDGSAASARRPRRCRSPVTRKARWLMARNRTTARGAGQRRRCPEPARLRSLPLSTIPSTNSTRSSAAAPRSACSYQNGARLGCTDQQERSFRGTRPDRAAKVLPPGEDSDLEIQIATPRIAGHPPKHRVRYPDEFDANTDTRSRRTPGSSARRPLTWSTASSSGSSVVSDAAGAPMRSIIASTEGPFCEFFAPSPGRTCSASAEAPRSEPDIHAP